MSLNNVLKVPQSVSNGVRMQMQPFDSAGLILNASSYVVLEDARPQCLSTTVWRVRTPRADTIVLIFKCVYLGSLIGR